MKRELFGHTIFANKVTPEGSKITLVAEDYDFKFNMFKQVTDATGKHSFELKAEIPLEKAELRILSTMIEAHLDQQKKISFKVREIVSDTPYGVCTMVTKSMHGIEVRGKYTMMEGGRKNRTVHLAVYKFSGWDEVKEFRRDSNSCKGNFIASMELNTFPASSGSWVYNDRLVLENLFNIVNNVYFRCNVEYTDFLKQVMLEGKGNDNKPTSPYTPKGAPEEEDKFPF